MSTFRAVTGVLLAALALSCGCMPAGRMNLAERTGGSAALFHQFQAYDGHSGRSISFRDVVARCRAADVILFGEAHSDVVCNQLEAQLLHALATQARPVCLAMEFFEADTQAGLDAYLRGRLAEAAFQKQTRQGRAYILSHRPLIEMCRAGHIPVIAANAPRRLVRAYRNSGLPYEEYRAGLDPTEQRWLPLTNEHLGGDYEKRFMEMMQGHALPPTTMPTTAPAEAPITAEAATPPAPTMQPRETASRMSPHGMYQAQLLWDQAMAESLADFRTSFPRHRVMLIVGGFHVAHTGGTALKYRARRPSDRVLTIAYEGTTDGAFKFGDDERGAGDVVIYGIAPPPEEEEPAASRPAAPPPTTELALPETQPTMPQAQTAVPPVEPAPAQTPPSQPVPPETAAPQAGLTPVVFTGPEVVIREALVIGKIGRWGRSAVHTDAIEAQIVAGEWKPPTGGQAVTRPDGKVQHWQLATAGDDGLFRDEALGGGYAYVAVECDGAQTAILEAAGHSLVYVNGTPRAGDPYQWGFVRLPVQLDAGPNHLLFACGRGEFRAKLLAPRAPVMLDTGDALLPDVRLGESGDMLGAIVIINASATPLTNAQLSAQCGDAQRATPVPLVPPESVRKVGFTFAPDASDTAGDRQLDVILTRAGTELDRATVTWRVRPTMEAYRRTFISDIDGSVQYYAVRPMLEQADTTASSPASGPALFLSLHGASVEAIGQASCYAPKAHGVVVAPTNRRPYGFDWEDWGRLDALEVLALAERAFGTDPRHTYLTGHSMGGHGTWQIGAHYPDRFAAIAPSAGWVSFWSYAGGPRTEDGTPIERILRRATNASDTLGLSRNYRHYGIYILHGDQDDNVPVAQARTMRKQLGEFHPNFAYYERPGAGHWWGNECMDWPPLFDFLRQNTRPAAHTVRDVEFVTASPAISATCDWATIEAQQRWLDFSRIDLHSDAQQRTLRGTTDNVARLAIRLDYTDGQYVIDPNGPLTVELDGDRLDNTAWPAGGVLRLARRDGHWQIFAEAVDPQLKGPHRAGPFKDAFRHRMQFVHGTRGTAEESAWARAKARLDAEMFWVRGNGSVDVLADTEFDTGAEPERGVILYGNADTNAAWEPLLGRCPIQVTREHVHVGERAIDGRNLAVLLAYPRPGATPAMVAAVSGTGPPGLRLTERLPYFVAGVAYPDWVVLDATMLTRGTDGVRAAGFFGGEWQIDDEQSAFLER